MSVEPTTSSSTSGTTSSQQQRPVLRPEPSVIGVSRPRSALGSPGEGSDQPQGLPFESVQQQPQSEAQVLSQSVTRAEAPAPAEPGPSQRGVCGGEAEEEEQPAAKRQRVAPPGTKDRHSKVQTHSGLRDRRVRLSVPAALAFYEVQDRLGVDHPSAAVEWLLHHASHAIATLPQLPPRPGMQQFPASSIGAATSLAMGPPPVPGQPSAVPSGPAQTYRRVTSGRAGAVYALGPGPRVPPAVGGGAGALAAPREYPQAVPEGYPGVMPAGEFSEVPMYDSAAGTSTRAEARARARERARIRASGRDILQELPPSYYDPMAGGYGHGLALPVLSDYPQQPAARRQVSALQPQHLQSQQAHFQQPRQPRHQEDMREHSMYAEPYSPPSPHSPLSPAFYSSSLDSLGYQASPNLRPAMSGPLHGFEAPMSQLALPPSMPPLPAARAVGLPGGIAYHGQHALPPHPGHRRSPLLRPGYYPAGPAAVYGRAEGGHPMYTSYPSQQQAGPPPGLPYPQQLVQPQPQRYSPSQQYTHEQILEMLSERPGRGEGGGGEGPGTGSTGAGSSGSRPGSTRSGSRAGSREGEEKAKSESGRQRRSQR